MTFHDSPTDIPGPEVVPKAKRRKFSAKDKLRTLDESDNCTEPGQIGALVVPGKDNLGRLFALMSVTRSLTEATT
jgi:non-ribosomal peptide synthetase component E (peptide arylation enzyme)